MARRLAVFMSAAMCVIVTVPASGQERPTFYVHVGGAGAAALMSSGAIADLVPDYNVGISGHYSLLARAGFGQVLQGEYRQGNGNHDLRLAGFVEGGQIGIVDELSMDYEFTQWTVKFNPAGSTERSFPLYLVAGRVEADYFNEVGEGFNGAGTILGIELVGVTKNLSVTIGLKRHGLTFDPISAEFFGAPVAPTDSFSASNWILDFSIAAGLGM